MEDKHKLLVGMGLFAGLGALAYAAWEILREDSHRLPWD